MQRLVHCAISVSTAVLGQSHKDSVRCNAVEEQPEAKEVQLSHPSSTSLLMISPGTLQQSHTVIDCMDLYMDLYIYRERERSMVYYVPCCTLQPDQNQG